MTLKIFQKCDNRYDWNAYIRFGLYYVSRSGEKTNFCDIHMGWVPGNPIDGGVFSGPKDSTNQISRYERSHEAVLRYREQQQVHSDLELAAGGVAKLVHSRKRKTTDLWMFGPLLSEGVAYGSLVAELEGLEFPKHGHKFTPIPRKPGEKDEAYEERNRYDPKNQRFLAVFPKSYGIRYFPCKLWASTYAEGTKPWARGLDNVIYDGGSTVHYKDNRAPGEKDYVQPGPPPPLNEALLNARASLQPAFLPKGVTKVVWKIEDFAADQTACQVYARSG